MIVRFLCHLRTEGRGTRCGDVKGDLVARSGQFDLPDVQRRLDMLLITILVHGSYYSLREEIYTSVRRNFFFEVKLDLRYRT